jgi:hypothetical protein
VFCAKPGNAANINAILAWCEKGGTAAARLYVFLMPCTDLPNRNLTRWPARACPGKVDADFPEKTNENNNAGYE